MRVLGVFALCVVTSAAACSQQMGSGQGAGASTDGVAGSTGPITSTELADTGPIPIIAFGAAFGLDRGMIEQAVADEMRASTSGNARFVSSSQANVDPNGYSVVMLFNAPDGANPGAYCSDPPVPMEGPAQRYLGTGDVEIAGALCRKGEEVRQVWVGADDVWSLDDPGFRKLVGEAASKLAPPTGEPNALPSSAPAR